MIRKFALVVSVLFHPLLMATYGCVLLFFGIRNTVYDYLTGFDIKVRISLIVFLFSFVFPVLNIYILYRMGRIPAITLSKQEDRGFPYFMTSLFYFGLYYLLMDVNIWPSLKVFIVGAGLAIVLTALINTRYKISAHMVGLGGLLGVLVSVSALIQFDMTVFYILVILVAGLTATARLILEEHRPSQVYAGFLLGFLVQAGLFLGLQKMIFA
jgi:hypothetical protein